MTPPAAAAASCRQEGPSRPALDPGGATAGSWARARGNRAPPREPSWGRVEERGRVGEGARREGRGGGVSGAGRGGEETGGREDGRGRGIGRVRADKGIVVLWSYCEGI